jgi:hypothetical protein
MNDPQLHPLWAQAMAAKSIASAATTCTPWLLSWASAIASWVSALLRCSCVTNLAATDKVCRWAALSPSYQLREQTSSSTPK